MGSNAYGTRSGTLPNGGKFYTGRSLIDELANVVSLSAIEVAAVSLESSVSSALLASTGVATGTISAGWMSSGTVATLSASYSSKTGSIF